MKKKKEFLPKVPLYYSVPMLLVCIGALLILVALFNVEVPQVLFSPSNAINVSSCGTLNQSGAYYVLNQSIVVANVGVTGSACIIIDGNDITLDGESKYLISSSMQSGKTVNIRGNNSLVKGLNITSPFLNYVAFGILTTSTNNNTISGNTISNSIYGIASAFSNNNTISGNIISSSTLGIYSSSNNDAVSGNTISNSSSGITLFFSNNNTVSGNIISNSSQNAIQVSSSNNIALINNLIINPLMHRVVFYGDPNRISLNNLTVVNGNSSFYDIENLNLGSSVEFVNNISNTFRLNSAIVSFRNPGVAMVRFNQHISAISTSGANLSDIVGLEYNRAGVNSANSGWNRSANITFYGLPTNIPNATILRDGLPCPATICRNLTSLSAGTVVFNVTGWSNYSILFTPDMLQVNSPVPNKFYFQQDFPLMFNLSLNDTGSAVFSLNNGLTNFTMNSTNGRDFTYLQSQLPTGDYTFTAYASLPNNIHTKSVNFKVFNVSWMSNGNGQFSFANVSSCGVLNQNNTYYVLNTNILASSGNCISITGQNVILDGQHRYLINGGGQNGWGGIVLYGNNSLVMGLNITGYDYGIFVNFSSNKNTLSRNIINNSGFAGIYVSPMSRENIIAENKINFHSNGIYVDSNSTNNQLLGNVITHSNSNAITLYSDSSFNLLNGNIINRTYNGIYIHNKSNYNNFTGNLIDNSTLYSLYIFNSSYNRFTDLVVQNSRGNGIVFAGNNLINYFKNVSVIFGNLSNYDLNVDSRNSHIELIDSYFSSYRFNNLFAIFGTSEKGKINFTQNLSGSGTNLSLDVKIGSNYVDVNSSKAFLNKSAIITLENIPNGFFNGTIYRNGLPCPVDVCRNITSLNAGNVMFNVTGWTNYSVGEGTIPPLTPMISIDEPDSNERYSYGTAFPVIFRVNLNINGAVKFSLDNGATNVTMNTTNNVAFTYEQNQLAIGDYIFTAYANFFSGARLTDFVNFSVVNTAGSSTTGGSSGGSSSGSSGGTVGGSVGGVSGGNGVAGGVGGVNLGSGGSSGGTLPEQTSQGSVKMKDVIYWLIVAVVSIMILILILVIVKSLLARLAQNSNSSGNFNSNLR